MDVDARPDQDDQQAQEEFDSVESTDRTAENDVVPDAVGVGLETAAGGGLTGVLPSDDEQRNADGSAD